MSSDSLTVVSVADIANYSAAGGTLAALILFFVWQNRQFSLGKWVTGAQKDSEIEALKLGHQQIIAALTSQHDREISSANDRAEEWKDTTVEVRKALADQTEIAKNAVATNNAIDYVFQQLLPHSPNSGDNGRREVEPHV